MKGYAAIPTYDTAVTENKKIKIFSFLGFIFTSIIGTLLHFAFEFFDGNTLVGAFTPVNESVWEHLKLLLFPVIAFSVLEYIFYGKNIKNFFPAKIWSLLIGMVLTVLIFYTYSGIIGRSLVAVDISLFYLSVAITYFTAYQIMKRPTLLTSDNAAIISISVLTVIIIAFIFFTFNPPMLEIFRDPLTEDFGIIQSVSIYIK